MRGKVFGALHPLRRSVNLPSSSAWQIYRNRSRELIAVRDLSTTCYFHRFFPKKWFRVNGKKIIIFADDKRTKKRRIKVLAPCSLSWQSLVVAKRCAARAVEVVNFSFHFIFSLSSGKSPPADRGRVPVDVLHGAPGT